MKTKNLLQFEAGLPVRIENSDFYIMQENSCKYVFLNEFNHPVQFFIKIDLQTCLFIGDLHLPFFDRKDLVSSYNYIGIHISGLNMYYVELSSPITFDFYALVHYAAKLLQKCSFTDLGYNQR